MENTPPFLSANCLTENEVVMASTKAAGDTRQAKPLPVGSLQKLGVLSMLLLVGVTNLAVVPVRLL